MSRPRGSYCLKFERAVLNFLNIFTIRVSRKLNLGFDIVAGPDEQERFMAILVDSLHHGK